MACPSASTDGKRVYFTFENGVIAAFDFDGEQKWKRKLEDQYGSVQIKFGYSSTPLLFDGRMYVLVLRHPDQYRGDDGKPRDSFILAVNPVTGKNIFKQPRQFKVLEETYDSYTSAIPFVHNGRKEILVNAAEYLTGHDPATGKELWRYKYCLRSIRWGRNIASVVTGSGMVFGSRERGNDFYAVRSNAPFIMKIIGTILKSGEGTLKDLDLAYKSLTATDNIFRSNSNGDLFRSLFLCPGQAVRH